MQRACRIVLPRTRLPSSPPCTPTTLITRGDPHDRSPSDIESLTALSPSPSLPSGRAPSSLARSAPPASDMMMSGGEEELLAAWALGWVVSGVAAS
eukprot:137889-Rhodomonas_salina.1